MADRAHNPRLFFSDDSDLHEDEDLYQPNHHEPAWHRPYNGYDREDSDGLNLARGLVWAMIASGLFWAFLGLFLIA